VHGTLLDGNSGYQRSGKAGTLRWEEFAARHGCLLESEPSIQQSLQVYYHECGALINSSLIQTAVNRPKDLVGISVRDQKATAFGRNVQVWKPRLYPILADLTALAEQVELPNVQFITWLHDGACISARRCTPVFVQEKSSQCNGGVFFPPRSAGGFVSRFTGGAGDGELLSTEANMRVAREDNAVPFGTKVDKAFFRGTLTGGVCSKESWRSMPRTQLVQVSRKRERDLY